MFRKTVVALVGSAWVWFAGFDAAQAQAFEDVGPPYGEPVEQGGPAAPPVYAAPAERSNLGGGLIEFLFRGSPDQGRMSWRERAPYEPLPAEPVEEMEPAMAPDAFHGGDERMNPASRGFNPIFERQLVEYPGPEAPGTIVVDTPHKFLYLVQYNGMALRYGIGVGRPGFTWSGVKRVSAKREWPDWTPPAQMLERRPDLPRHMEGGIHNPLGARAIYLGSSLYRIHGSNEPWTIGTNVSSGCIRMRNQDVIDLYGRVTVGTRVIVI
ncbi:MAG: L,D-transpeptidase [Alphaproteobacteria bacterium]|nr:L,D-transpeptidase [Alphaproteobacteria bacterium]